MDNYFHLSDYFQGNMNKKAISFIFFILFILTAYPSFPQESLISAPPQRTYNEAVNLFEQKNYVSSQTMFEKFKQEINDPSNAFYEGASYYQVICAVNLKSKDAFKKAGDFEAAYPESGWMPAIRFELGKMYFQKRKYKEALKAFKDVSPKKLNKDQRSEYYYKTGYCELQADRLDAAAASFSKVTGTKSRYAQPATYYSAYILYKNGDYQKALRQFNTLTNSRRYGKYVSIYILQIYYELGENQKVVDEGTVKMKTTDRKSKGLLAGLVANALYNLNDYTKALEYFALYENSARKSLSPEEQYRIGICKFYGQKYKAAINNFQQASKQNEEFVQNAWYYLGFCYLNTNEPKFAQSAFLKAYQQGNDKSLATDALYNYVKVTLELGGDLYNDPVKIVQDFITQNPDDLRIGEAYDLLARLYVTSKNYKGALQSIEQTSNPNPKLKEIYQKLAYSQATEYFNRAAYTDAISFFEKSLKYTPDKTLEAQSIYWMGDAFYHKKQYRDAQGLFARFLKLPDVKNSGLYALGLYSFAYTSFNLKQYSRAVDYFTRFLRLSNPSPNLVTDANLRLADSYFISKNYARALVWYNKVNNNNSRHTDYALYQKASCYGAEGEFGKKVNTLKTMVQRYISSTLYDDALFEIASTSLILNDQRSAIVYFDKLVKEKPNSSLTKKALLKMGFVYYNNNQNDRAVQTLKKVIDKYPASMEAKEALKTLQNIYMDMGKVNEYFAYTRNLDFVQVSTGEQDSLTFVSGENFYMNDNCNRAIPALKGYIQKYPLGGFILKAYHYLSDCFGKQGDKDSAMIYYEKIIKFPDNPYTEKALLKAARSMYDKKDFAKAYEYYSRLGNTTENMGMLLEANDGAMRSAYLLGNLQNTENYAQRLLKTENVTEEQIIYAHYILAKTALQQGNQEKAMQEFEITDKLTTGEQGAEAKYQMALINFNNKKPDEAEKLIYQLPEQYADYDYWIAKGFILLADIYVAHGNNFQAEQTLQSVIDNYPGEDLKKTARDKLDKIKQAGDEENPDNKQPKTSEK